MPLSRLGLNSTLSWQLTEVITGFQNAGQNDQVNYNLNNVNISTWDQLFAEEYSLAGSGGTTTFDLTSFTNLVSESVTLGHVLSITVSMISGAGPVNFVPGTSNGLQWFFGGSTDSINLTTGCSFTFSGPYNGTGTVVNSTNKTMTVTNNGSGTAVVKIVIAGSTT